jgi:hypothetical protein
MDKAELTHLYVDLLMSIPEISEKTGIALSTIRFRLKALGVLRSRADSIRLAVQKGKIGPSHRGKKRNFTEEWKQNISKARKAHGEKYAVGTSLKPSGYIEYTRGEHKRRRVHVVLMEQKIGRRLFANECVHHIDGNKTNNELSNLQLMTFQDHSRLHANERIAKRKGKSNDQ